jgi:CrcB protein
VLIAPWLAVGLGGAIGSIARHALGVTLRSWLPGAGFPWATLLVNVLGGLAIGLLAGGGLARLGASETVRLGLITGVLGGFTTFSAFSLESARLLQDAPLLAVANVVANVSLSLGACLCGLWLARALLS